MPSLIRISIQVLLFALLTVVLSACIITFTPLRGSTPTVVPSVTPIPTLLVQATQPIPSPTFIPTLIQAIQPESVFTPVSTRVRGPGPERIHFDPGATSAMIRGRFTSPGRKEYILNATAGQVPQPDASVCAVIIHHGDACGRCHRGPIGRHGNVTDLVGLVQGVDDACITGAPDLHVTGCAATNQHTAVR